MKWIGIAALCLLVASLSGCGGADTFTASGVLRLAESEYMGDSGSANPGEICVSEGGYDDIDAGAQVVIRDGAGKTLAFGHLTGGRVPEDASDGACDFQFEVAGVPAGMNVYTVEVAHRGEVNFHETDAGHLALTLGG